MCKRDCNYAGTENIHIGAGEHCCNYVIAALGTESEQKTRLGQLVKKYRLPSTHRKIRLLMLGENCPFYDPLYPGEKKPRADVPILPRKPREKKEYKAPAAEESLMALYEDGLSDKKIADSLGLKEFQVLRWRQERNLPSKAFHRMDEERAREMYYAGKSDREIAKELGVAAQTVCNWRSKEKLKSTRQYAKINYDQLQELYDKGMNDSQISQATGHCTDSIRKWRKQNGLKSNFEATK